MCMRHKKKKTESAAAASRANLIKEIAEPRITRSAKIALRNLSLRGKPETSKRRRLAD